MSNINNQAKNEVHELLRELVVSPISDNLKKQLKEISDQIEQLFIEQEKQKNNKKKCWINYLH